MRRKLLLLAIVVLLPCCGTLKKQIAFHSYIFGKSTNCIYKQYNAEIYVTPASCQKIITALLAYKKLGTDHRYVTKAYNRNNDILLLFDGDPSLTTYDLIDLVRPLKGKRNKVIIDISKFKTPAISNNIMKGDVGTTYAQPVSAMILDANLIKVMFRYNNDRIIASNDMQYKINSSVKMGDKTSIKLSWIGDTINVEGAIEPKDFPLEKYISPCEINTYIKKKISYVLKQVGIGYKEIVITQDNNTLLYQADEGTINNGKIFSHYSRPLKELLPIAFKKSNNLFFDSLYLTIISDENPLDWHYGSEIIKKMTKEYFNIDLKKAILVDGSGLSRYNLIQTKSLYEFLIVGNSISEFKEAFPHSQEHGTTLANRKNLPPSVIAKTGNLMGINCLCGYNNSVAFAIVSSNFPPPAKDIRDMHDQLIKTLS